MISIRNDCETSLRRPGTACRVSNAAFSLIELLVVVSLIAVLAASVAVSIRGAQDSHALKTASADLAVAIRFGFEESRLKGVAHCVAFAEDGRSYRIEFFTGDVAEPRRPVAGMGGTVKRLQKDVEVVAIKPFTGEPLDTAGADVLCAIGAGGFNGAIELRNRQGETITLEVLSGTGQVHVVE